MSSFDNSKLGFFTVEKLIVSDTSSDSINTTGNVVAANLTTTNGTSGSGTVTTNTLNASTINASKNNSSNYVAVFDNTGGSNSIKNLCIKNSQASAGTATAIDMRTYNSTEDPGARISLTDSNYSGILRLQLKAPGSIGGLLQDKIKIDPGTSGAITLTGPVSADSTVTALTTITGGFIQTTNGKSGVGTVTTNSVDTTTLSSTSITATGTITGGTLSTTNGTAGSGTVTSNSVNTNAVTTSSVTTQTLNATGNGVSYTSTLTNTNFGYKPALSLQNLYATTNTATGIDFRTYTSASDDPQCSVLFNDEGNYSGKFQVLVKDPAQNGQLRAKMTINPGNNGDIVLSGPVVVGGNISTLGGVSVPLGNIDIGVTGKLLMTVPCMERYHNTTQSINNSTETVVQFNTLGMNQGGVTSLISYDTNNHRFKNVSGRTYVALITYQVCWSANGTGIRTVQIFKGGANRYAVTSIAPSASDFNANSGSLTCPWSNNEEMWVVCWQTSGGTLLTSPNQGGGQNKFHITLL